MSTVQDRFSKYFERKEKSDCWIWHGGRTHDNYGKFWFDKTMKAHKVSYLIYKGDIPRGLCVMHTCDNPPCVNPSHLRIGTQQENIADRDSKGRGKENRLNLNQG
jgi:hypothetical protein